MEILEILNDKLMKAYELESMQVVEGNTYVVGFKSQEKENIVVIYFKTGGIKVPLLRTTSEDKTIKEMIEIVKTSVQDIYKSLAPIIEISSRILIPAKSVAELNGRLQFLNNKVKFKEIKETFIDLLREFESLNKFDYPEIEASNELFSYMNKELSLLLYKRKVVKNLSLLTSSLLDSNKVETEAIINGIGNGKSKGLAAYIAAS